MKPLNSQAVAQIKAIVERHKDEKGPAIVMLHDVQNELGYIPFEAMDQIAKATNSSVAKIYGVVTFYSQFTTQPRGKHCINVCLGTACYVKGSQALLDDIIELTKAPVNGTSPDGFFSLDATRCLGACGLAPVVVIDGEVHGKANVGMKVLDEIASLMASDKA